MQVKTALKQLSLALGFAFATNTQANIQIFPAQGIFGLEQPCRQSADLIEANGSSISCDFTQAVSNDVIRHQVSQTFLSQLKPT